MGSNKTAILLVCITKRLPGPVQHNATYVELVCCFSAVSPSQFNITAALPWKNEFDINKLDISFEEEYPPGSRPTSPTPL